MTAIIDGVIKDEIEFLERHLIFSLFLLRGHWQVVAEWDVKKKKIKRDTEKVGVKETHVYHMPSSMRKGGRIIHEKLCVPELLNCNLCKIMTCSKTPPLFIFSIFSISCVKYGQRNNPFRKHSQCAVTVGLKRQLLFHHAALITTNTLF